LVGAPVDAESCNEVLVQLEPDAMARIDFAARHPLQLSASRTPQRRGEPHVVAAEPVENVLKLFADRCESVLDLTQFSEHTSIPIGVRVVVGNETFVIVTVRPELPVRAGAQQPLVEWKNLAIDLAQVFS